MGGGKIAAAIGSVGYYRPARWHLVGLSKYVLFNFALAVSMDPAEPIISVLLPVYNGMPLLPATVESVLAQTEKR